MVAFALSCFGILLFLWLSFGGSVPLQPQGYRVHVSFPEATQLAQEAEVRISGVKVGKVRRVEPNGETGLTDTMVEIDPRYAPIPTRYPRDPAAEDAAWARPTWSCRRATSARRAWSTTAARSRRARCPTPSSWTRSCARSTRSRAGAFSTWLDQQGQAVRGNGRGDQRRARQPRAVRRGDRRRAGGAAAPERRHTPLVRDTGEVFGALSERQGQLRDLIVNSNRVWETTARRDAELADTFRVLPDLPAREPRRPPPGSPVRRDTNPLIDQLRPAARELSPTLVELEGLAPDLRGFFQDLDPLVRVSRRGPPGDRARYSTTPDRCSAARPVPAPVHADHRLPRALPARDRGLLRERRGGDAGHRSAPGDRRAGALPANSRIPPTRRSWRAIPTRLSTNRSNPYPEPGGYDKLPHEAPPGRSSATTSARPAGAEPARAASRPTSSRRSRYFTYGGSQNRGAAPPCDPAGARSAA